MKILHLLTEEDNLETIVKIDKMPEYKVVNPSEEEQNDAQKDKEASLPAEVTDNPKTEEPTEEPKKSDKPTDAVKTLVVKLLDDIKSFLESI